MYKAIVIGATGAVGNNLVKELVNSSKCELVTIIGRRQLELEGVTNSPKVQQHIIDMEKIEEETMKVINGHQVAFSTLGVGQPTKIPRQELIKIEQGYTDSFAKACKSCGVRHLSLLSAVGVDINSSFFYMSHKAKIEENLTNIKFNRVSFFRPSVLVTPGNRYGFTDTFNQHIFPKLTWMLPARYHEIKIEKLAKAMRINAENEPKGVVEILEFPQFIELLKLENDIP